MDRHRQLLSQNGRLWRIASGTGAVQGTVEVPRGPQALLADHGRLFVATELNVRVIAAATNTLIASLSGGADHLAASGGSVFASQFNTVTRLDGVVPHVAGTITVPTEHVATLESGPAGIWVGGADTICIPEAPCLDTTNRYLFLLDASTGTSSANVATERAELYAVGAGGLWLGLRGGLFFGFPSTAGAHIDLPVVTFAHATPGTRTAQVLGDVVDPATGLRWVATWKYGPHTTTVIEAIDPVTNRPARSITLDRAALGLAQLGDALYALIRSDPVNEFAPGGSPSTLVPYAIVRIDLATGVVGAPVPVGTLRQDDIKYYDPDAGGVFFVAAGDLWMYVYGRFLIRVDPATGVRRATIPAPAGIAKVRSDGGELWAIFSGTLPAYACGSMRPVTRSVPTCRSVAGTLVDVADGDLWYTTHHDGVGYAARIDPASCATAPSTASARSRRSA